jgi:hypothetical protein
VEKGPLFCEGGRGIIRSVYLRRNRRTIDGETCACWTLVESVRTALGVRQHTVAPPIFVWFLALALWRTPEMGMPGKGLRTCARQWPAEVTTLKSLDVVLAVRTPDAATGLRLPTVGKPEPRVAERLQFSDITCPLAPEPSKM